MLEADEELSADAVAVAATGRPLSMASALGKVWQALSTLDSGSFAGVPAYAGGPADLIEQRMQRLLAGQAVPTSAVLGRCVAVFGLVVSAELSAQLLTLIATTIPFVCGMRVL